MFYVTFENHAGVNATGCYSPDLHPDLFIEVDGEIQPHPQRLLAAAVPITEDQHQLYVQGRLRVDPDTLVASAYRESDVEILDQAKHQKRKQITAYRRAEIGGGLVHGGYVWDTDDNSRALLTGAIAGVNAGLALPDGFAWTAADDEDVPMDAAGLLALGAALTVHVNAAHVKSRQLKAQISAIELAENVTLEDALAALETINW